MNIADRTRGYNIEFVLLFCFFFYTPYKTFSIVDYDISKYNKKMRKREREK